MSDRVVPSTTIEVTLMGTDYVATLERASYADGSPALRLWADDGVLATATVFLAGQPAAEGCVWIKDWSENSGMFTSLIAAGVIEPTGRTAQTGFATAHEGRLL
jgi:hypothetical protein